MDFSNTFELLPLTRTTSGKSQRLVLTAWLIMLSFSFQFKTVLMILMSCPQVTDITHLTFSSHHIFEKEKKKRKTTEKTVTKESSFPVVFHFSMFLNVGRHVYSVPYTHTLQKPGKTIPFHLHWLHTK